LVFDTLKEDLGVSAGNGLETKPLSPSPLLESALLCHRFLDTNGTGIFAQLKNFPFIGSCFEGVVQGFPFQFLTLIFCRSCKKPSTSLAFSRYNIFSVFGLGVGDFPRCGQLYR